MTAKQEEMLRLNAEGKIHLSDIATAREFAAAGDDPKCAYVARPNQIQNFKSLWERANNQPRAYLEYSHAQNSATVPPMRDLMNSQPLRGPVTFASDPQNPSRNIWQSVANAPIDPEFQSRWERANRESKVALVGIPDNNNPAARVLAEMEEEISAAQAERNRMLMAGNFIGVLEEVKDHFAPDHSIFQPDHSKFDKKW